MTILKVINEVADIVSLNRFESVYGSANPAAQTMLELASLAGEEISQRYDWKCLEKSDVTVLSPYTLPEDYGRLIEGGAVIGADGQFFRPVKNPSQWAVVKQVPSAQRYFYLSSNMMHFSPLADGVGATIIYITKNWVLGSDGTRKGDWTADDDTTPFPERLLLLNMIWRWKRQKGLAYDDPLAEFEAAMLSATEEDRG